MALRFSTLVAAVATSALLLPVVACSGGVDTTIAGNGGEPPPAESSAPGAAGSSSPAPAETADAAVDPSADAGALLADAAPLLVPGDSGEAPSTCATDFDCSSKDLCVEGVCRRACHGDAVCGGGTCHVETDAGWCYNAPGCNPPPPGKMCPRLCYGYCE
jgi:hypothetical protein